MKKKIIFLFILFFILLNITGIDKEKINPYLKPSSVVFNLYFSPFFNIYNPEFRGLSIAFASTFDFGVSYQYRFSKFIGIESGFYLNSGFDFTESKYIESNTIVSYSQNTFSLFLDVPFNAIIYVPFEKEFKNNYKLIFLIKSGFVLDFWLYSFYRVEKEGTFIQEGSFHDNVIDGPNQFNRFVDYSKIINPVNLGLNLSFGLKFHSNRWISIYPELGAKFFLLPVLYGYNERKGGYDLLLSRNDGNNDKSIFDFKIQIYTGVGISIDFGNYNDNLYDIIKNKKDSSR